MPSQAAVTIDQVISTMYMLQGGGSTYPTYAAAKAQAEKVAAAKPGTTVQINKIVTTCVAFVEVQVVAPTVQESQTLA